MTQQELIEEQLKSPEFQVRVLSDAFYSYIREGKGYDHDVTLRIMALWSAKAHLRINNDSGLQQKTGN